MAKLALFLPDGTPMDLPLNKERITIGRRADNDVCLANLAVSSEHAAVVTILADSFLEDLRSTNGTLVNGKPVSKHFLRDGDEFDVGRHLFVYVEDDAHQVERRLPSNMPRLATRKLGEQVEHVKSRLGGAPTPGATDDSTPNIDAARSEGAVERTRPPHRSRGQGIRSRAAHRADASAVNEVKLPALATLRLLSGARAGESVALVKQETTLGRAGVQVVAILAAGDVFRLRRVEGNRTVTVNGQAVDGDDVDLHSGDIIELGDTRLEFVGVQADALSASST